MAHKEPSRVRQGSVTTGTGAYALGEVPQSFRAFSAALSDGDTVDYVAVMGGNYELGRGTYSGGSLTRTAVFLSTNANAAVDWPAGTKDIAACRAGLSDLDAGSLADLLALMVQPGIAYLWNTSTSNADPGTGKLAINHATPASATALYISETDADGGAMAAILATWDDGSSTIRGRLRAVDPATGDFLELDITGTLTDNGGWDTFAITPAGGVNFANATPVRLFFTAKGDKGDTGPAAADISWADNANTSIATSTSDESTGIRTTSASAVAIELHNDANVGKTIAFIQGGAGQITFTAESGGALENVHGYTKSFGEDAMVFAHCRANAGSAAIWQLFGYVGL